MNDLIKKWHEAMNDTARTAAEAVVAGRAGRLDDLTSAAERTLAAATEASQRADRAAALVETLHKVLAEAPREAFLSSASMVLLMQVDVFGGRRSEDPARYAWNMLRGNDRAHSVLIQRNQEGLPEGRYAVVVSYHRIDGGEP